MQEFGRVVLDGIVFDFNSADLLPASDTALGNITAKCLLHIEVLV